MITRFLTNFEISLLGIVALPSKQDSVWIRDGGQETVMLMLVCDDSRLWMLCIGVERAALLANNGVTSGNCEGLSKLECGGKKDGVATVEHTAIDELVTEWMGLVGAGTGYGGITAEEVGARDTGVFEDGIAIVITVVCDLQTVWQISATARTMKLSLKSEKKAR